MNHAKNPFKKLWGSIRGKILLSFFLCIIVPITTILIVLYMSLGDVVSDQVRQQNRDALSQVTAGMNDLAERILKASNLIINDPEFVSFLETDEDWISSYQALHRYESVQQKLVNVRDILLDSGAVIAVMDDRGYVHSTSSSPNESAEQLDLLQRIAAEPWMDRTAAEKGWPVWQFPYTGHIQ